MSLTEEEHEIVRTAARISALLKEYTKKLREMSSQLREVQSLRSEAMKLRRPDEARRAEGDYQTMRFGYLRLLTAANDLARQASQMVEHAKLETVARLELALRTAEFEAALHEAQQRVNAGPNG